MQHAGVNLGHVVAPDGTGPEKEETVIVLTLSQVGIFSLRCMHRAVDKLLVWGCYNLAAFPAGAQDLA